MTCSVCRVSLSGKQEDDGALGVVHNLAETLQVGKEQMCTLISSKAAAEADNQSIVVETLDEFDNSLRIALILQPSLLVLFGDILEEFLLQSLTGFPNLFVRAVVDAVPNLFVRLIAKMLRVEILGINLSPFRSTPSREVNTVGNIADMALLGIIATHH